MRLDGRHCLVHVDVARTRAIFELAGRIKHGHWPHELRVHLRSEPVCVTSGAVRLVGWEFPSDRLRVCYVASRARDRRAMIWVERRSVPTIYGCPRRRPMARLTR
jgi:hypothetical protein